MKVRPINWGQIYKNGTNQGGSQNWIQNDLEEKDILVSYNQDSEQKQIAAYVTFQLPINEISVNSIELILDSSSVQKDFTATIGGISVLNSNSNSSIDIGYGWYVDNNSLSKSPYEVFIDGKKGILNASKNGDIVTLTKTDNNLNDLIQTVRADITFEGEVPRKHSTITFFILNSGNGAFCFNPSKSRLKINGLIAAPYHMLPSSNFTFLRKGGEISPFSFFVDDDESQNVDLILQFGKNGKRTVTTFENVRGIYNSPVVYEEIEKDSEINEVLVQVVNEYDNTKGTEWIYNINPVISFEKITIEGLIDNKCNEGDEIKVSFSQPSGGAGSYSYCYKIGADGTEQINENSSFSILAAESGDYIFYVKDILGDISEEKIQPIITEVFERPTLKIINPYIRFRQNEQVTFDFEILNPGNLNLSQSVSSSSGKTYTWSGNRFNIIPTENETLTFTISYLNETQSAIGTLELIPPSGQVSLSNFIVETYNDKKNGDALLIKKILRGTITANNAIRYKLSVLEKDKNNGTYSNGNEIELLESGTPSFENIILPKELKGKFFTFKVYARNEYEDYDKTLPYETSNYYFYPNQITFTQKEIDPLNPEDYICNQFKDGNYSNIHGANVSVETIIPVSAWQGDKQIYFNITLPEILDDQLNLKTSNMVKVFIDEREVGVSVGEVVNNKVNFSIGRSSAAFSKTENVKVYLIDESDTISESYYSFSIKRIDPPHLNDFSGAKKQGIAISINGTHINEKNIFYFSNIKEVLNRSGEKNISFLMNNHDGIKSLVETSVGYKWKIKIFSDNEETLNIEDSSSNFRTIPREETVDEVTYSLSNFKDFVDSFIDSKSSYEIYIYASLIDVFGQEQNITGAFQDTYNIIYAEPPKFPDEPICKIGLSPFRISNSNYKLRYEDIFYTYNESIDIKKQMINPSGTVFLQISKPTLSDENAEYFYKVSYLSSKSPLNYDIMNNSSQYNQIIEEKLSPMNFEDINRYFSGIIDNGDTDFIKFSLKDLSNQSIFYYFKIDAVTEAGASTGLLDYPSLFSQTYVLKSRVEPATISLSNFNIEENVSNRNNYTITFDVKMVDVGGNNIGSSIPIANYRDYPNLDKQEYNFNEEENSKSFSPSYNLKYIISNTLDMPDDTAKWSSYSGSIFTIDNFSDFQDGNNTSVSVSITVPKAGLSDNEKIYLFVQLGYQAYFNPDATNNEDLIASLNSRIASSIYYMAVPTLAYRKNFLGINTSEYGDIDIFNIDMINDRKIINFRGITDNLQNTLISFDLSTGEITNVIIDAGTWN